MTPTFSSFLFSLSFLVGGAVIGLLTGRLFVLFFIAGLIGFVVTGGIQKAIDLFFRQR